MFEKGLSTSEMLENAKDCLKALICNSVYYDDPESNADLGEAYVRLTRIIERRDIRE